MKKVIQFSLMNKLAIWIVTILLSAAGIYSGITMKLETIPKITAPLVSITTAYPGATPEEVMNKVTIPIEQQVQNLDGVSTVISTSFQNASSIQIEYDYSKDMEKAQAEAEEAIKGLTFPDSVSEPEVSRLNLNEYPIMSLSVSDDKKSLEELTAFVEGTIVPRLKGLDGVAAVQTSGNQVQEIKLTFHKEKLTPYGLDEETVKNVIKGSNITLPLGLHTFEHEEKSVVVDGNIMTIEDLKKLKIPVQANPQAAGRAPDSQAGTAEGTVPSSGGLPTIELQEIAAIELAGKAESISRTNGKVSIGVQIVKTTDANTVDVVNAVKEKADELEAEFSGLNMTTVMDQGKPIEDSVETMLSKAVFGALFAMLIILLFLRNFKTTVISVISIPLSLLMAFTILKQMGITLNIMTLGAMTVAIGRVIDDSIVVIENIFRRMSMEGEGLKGKELIVEATKEMFIPIASSTIVTIAVFLPLALVKGPIGELFMPFALTVVFSLLASLLIAITVVPMLAHSFFKNGLQRESKPRERVVKVKHRKGSKAKWLTGIKQQRILLCSAAVLLLISSAFVPADWTTAISVLASILLLLVIVSTVLPASSHKEGEWGAEEVMDQPSVQIEVSNKERSQHESKPGRLSEGYKRVLQWSLNHKLITSLLAVSLLIGSLFLIPVIGVSFLASDEQKMVYAAYTPEPGQPYEEVVKIAEQAEKLFQSRKGVKTIQFSLGSENSMNPGQSNTAVFYVEYEKDKENFAKESEAVMKELQKGVTKGEWNSMNMSSTGADNSLSMIVYGESIEDIQPVVQKLEKIFKDNKELTNVETTLSKSYEEYTLVADQDKLSRLGLTAAQIGMALSEKGNREVLTTIKHKDNELNVYLEEEEEGYKNIEDLTAKTIQSPLGVAVPVNEVTRVVEGTTSDTLTRRDGRIYASVSGEIKTKDVAGISTEVQKKADKLKLPENVEVSMSGVTEQMTDSFMQLGLAICAAIAIVYFVLVVTFGGGLAPFAILFSLPFTVIGGFIGLLAADETISVSAMIGFLMLIGIVVTNAIVLIDRVIHKEKEGLSTREALLEAAGTRLRPILMTAIATIGALIPLAIGMEGSGLISKGLGVTVIGGLISSTLLTLLIVPIVYETLMKMTRKGKRLKA